MRFRSMSIIWKHWCLFERTLAWTSSEPHFYGVELLSP